MLLNAIMALMYGLDLRLTEQVCCASSHRPDQSAPIENVACLFAGMSKECGDDIAKCSLHIAEQSASLQAFPFAAAEAERCQAYLIGDARQGCPLKALSDAPAELVCVLDALEEEAVVCTTGMQ